MTRFFKYYMNSTNSCGILVTDTWLFYKRSFDCSNFKGTGLENNYAAVTLFCGPELQPRVGLKLHLLATIND